MRTNHTQIAVVLDRSGSMASIREGTQAGYNEFLKAQKAAPGTADLLLTQFDQEYDIVYDGDVQRALPLTLVPRGSTALLDAIGRTIVDLGQRLDAKPEDERPDKVVFVIATDGQENASRTYTRSKVFEMIGHQRTLYNWQFIFLAANQDAIAEAMTIGGQAMANNAATFRPTNSGMFRNMQMAASKVASYRVSGAGRQSLNYTSADRDALADDETTTTTTTKP